VYQERKPDMTHYLDAKDPTFVKDLELSDVHVGRLVDKLNERMKQVDFASCLPGEIVGLKLVKADLVVRKSAAQRKSCSDKGDVVVSWTRHGKTESAIIEVKERRGQRFSRLEEFKFASMFVDTASKFDKIVKRGDTLGYLLTSANHECIFGVGLGVMRKHSRTTLQKNFRWATNMVELAKEHFTEGIDQVCNMVESLVTDFRSSSKDQLELLGIERDLAARRASLAALERSAESDRQAIQKLLLAKASCRLSDFASSIAPKYSSNTLSPNSTPSSPNSTPNLSPGVSPKCVYNAEKSDPTSSLDSTPNLSPGVSPNHEMKCKFFTYSTSASTTNISTNISTTNVSAKVSTKVLTNVSCDEKCDSARDIQCSKETIIINTPGKQSRRKRTWLCDAPNARRSVRLALKKTRR
jgi:hypothetical protein